MSLPWTPILSKAVRKEEERSLTRDDRFVNDF